MTKILLEGLLSSQFKWGFELEAYSAPQYASRFSYDHNRLSQDLKETFKCSGVLKGDGSLSSHYTDQYGFEFASEVLDFKPERLLAFKQGLNKLAQEGFITDDTCGMHIHVSWPGIKTADAAWMIFCYANDINARIKFTSLENTNIKLVQSYYAKTDFLDEIQRATINRDMNRIIGLMSNEKYRVLHLHSQGTVEWRGPRGFLSRANRLHIAKFVTTFYGLVQWMTKVLDYDEAYGIKKKDFVNDTNMPRLLNTVDDVKSYIKRNSKSSAKLRQILSADPALINKIKVDDDTMASLLTDSQIGYNVWQALVNKDKRLHPALVNKILEKDYPPTELLSRVTDKNLAKVDPKLLLKYFSKFSMLRTTIPYNRIKNMFSKNEKYIDYMIAVYGRRISDMSGLLDDPAITGKQLLLYCMINSNQFNHLINNMSDNNVKKLFELIDEYNGPDKMEHFQRKTNEYAAEVRQRFGISQR